MTTTTTGGNDPIALTSTAMSYHRIAAVEEDKEDLQTAVATHGLPATSVGVVSSNVIGTTTETTMSSSSAAEGTAMNQNTIGLNNLEPYIKYSLDSTQLWSASQNAVTAMPPLIASRGVSQEQWSDFWTKTNVIISSTQKQRRFYHITCTIAFFVILIASPILLHVILDGKVPSWGMALCKVATLISLLSVYFGTANYISYIYHQKIITFFHEMAWKFRPYGFALECQQQTVDTLCGPSLYTLYWNPIVAPSINDNETYEDDDFGQSTTSKDDDDDGWSKPQEGYYRIRHIHYNYGIWTPINLSRFSQGSRDLPIELAAELQRSTTDDHWNDLWSQFHRVSQAYVTVYRRFKVTMILCILFYLLYRYDGIKSSVAHTLFLVTLFATVMLSFQCAEAEQQCRFHIVRFATNVAQPRGYYMEYRTVYHYNETRCCFCYLLSKSTYIYIIPFTSAATSIA